MTSNDAPDAALTPRPAELSTPELLKEIAEQLKELVKTQIKLAKVELRAELAAGEKMAVSLGVAIVAAVATLETLLVAAILALAPYMPAWLAALSVSAFTLFVAVIAAVIGWSHRARRPFSRTRHELEEELKWTTKKTV